MKSMVLGAMALMVSAGAAVADEWEAITVVGSTALAVDWASLQIKGDVRRINMAMVTRDPEAGRFDWATSLLEIDCAQPRYMTVRSSFFYIDGSSAAADFVGDGSWTALSAGSAIDEIRKQTCAAALGKEGYFDDPLSFAVAGRKVMREQAGA